jgi:hypothetical protein
MPVRLAYVLASPVRLAGALKDIVVGPPPIKFASSVVLDTNAEPSAQVVFAGVFCHNRKTYALVEPQEVQPRIEVMSPEPPAVRAIGMVRRPPTACPVLCAADDGVADVLTMPLSNPPKFVFVIAPMAFDPLDSGGSADRATGTGTALAAP